MCNANPDCRQFGYTCCVCLGLPFILCGKGYQIARAKWQGRPRPRDRIAPQGCMRRRGRTDRRDESDDNDDAYNRRTQGERAGETSLPPVYDPNTRPNIEYDIDGNPVLQMTDLPPAYAEAPPPPPDGDTSVIRLSSAGAVSVATDDEYLDVVGIELGEEPPPYIPSAPSSPTNPGAVSGHDGLHAPVVNTSTARQSMLSAIRG